MVVAEFGQAVNPLPIALFANRPIFDDRQWDSLSKGLNRWDASRRTAGCVSAITTTWEPA